MYRLHHAMAELERLRHLGAPDVQVPVLQAQCFVGLDVILDREGRRLGDGDHLDIVRHHLDLAGRHLRVLGSTGPA